MSSRKRSRAPTLQRSLSALSSDISKWTYFESSSPSCTNLLNSEIRLHSNPKDIYSNIDKTSVPWYQVYSPRNVAEVAIHKRKLQDVKQALDSMLSGEDDTRILLLTGPSGSSKSTLISQLAPVLTANHKAKASGNSLRMQSHSVPDESIIEYDNDSSSNFHEFLAHAKYRTGQNLSVILVESLPNVFHEATREQFKRDLLEWLYSSAGVLPPLIICLTECEIENDLNYSDKFGIDYTFTAETVLGSEVLSHPKLRRIKFNPVNTTLMKKHLLSVCFQNRECLLSNNKWSAKDAFISQLAQSTGDIRSGITTLEFWAKSSSKFPIETRENSISYFHSIGKILYGSSEYKDDNEMINKMMESFKHHLSNRNSRIGLLENYGSFNKGQFNIKTATQITDALSKSDTFEKGPESLEYAIRSLRCILCGIKKDSTINGKSFFPREWKIRRLEEEFKVKSDDYTNVSMYKYGQSRRTHEVALQFGFYDPFIRSLQYYKKKAFDHYLFQVEDPRMRQQIGRMNEAFPSIDVSIDVLNRIGGDIRMIDSLDTIISEDNNQHDRTRTLLQLKQNKADKLNTLIMQKGKELALADDHEGDEDFVNDPIIDSEEEIQCSNSFLLEEDNDSFYDQLVDCKETVDDKAFEESLSDPDLEML